MITAVDTNVLIDVLSVENEFAAASETRLRSAHRSGALIVSEPVIAELASLFATPADITAFLDDLDLAFVPSSQAALHRAGRAWTTYARRRPAGVRCPGCGASARLRCASCGTDLRMRQHIVSDFMIGAHAVVHADQLLTRDRRLFGRYFPELRLPPA